MMYHTPKSRKRKTNYRLYGYNWHMNTKITKYAVGHALLTTLYIVLISSFLFYIPKTLNFDKSEDTVFAPILMLSLLVFSASTVGSLIFARPILWCLDGQKKEAVRLLSYTLLTFFILTAIIFAFFSIYMSIV